MYQYATMHSAQNFLYRA